MKGRAKLSAVAAALAVLAGAWYLAESMENPPEEAAEVLAPQTQILLSAGAETEICGLSWTFEGETVELVLDGETKQWEKKDDPACPIDQEAVKALVSSVANVTAGRAISGVRDFAQYGLENPVMTILAETGEGGVTYELGGQTLNGESYLRADGGDAVYTESGGLLPAFSVTLEELIFMDTAPGDVAEVASLSVTTDVTGYELRGGEKSDTGGWKVTEGEVLRPLSEEGAQMLFSHVLDIAFYDLVDWNGGDGAAYGLDTPQGLAVLRYRGSDGGEKSFGLEFGDYINGLVYVRIAGTGRVYTADGAVLDGLMYPDWEAMAPLDLFPVDMNEVSGAEITLNGHTYKVDIITERTERVEETGQTVTEEVICYVSDGWTLPAQEGASWFEMLARLEAESSAGTAEGREELLALSVFREGEETPAATLELRNYDSSRCLCIANGESRYFVLRTQGEELIRKAESLLVME